MGIVLQWELDTAGLEFDMDYILHIKLLSAFVDIHNEWYLESHQASEWIW